MLPASRRNKLGPDFIEDHLSTECKICGARTTFAFSASLARVAGEPDPGVPPFCEYHLCDGCGFCFTDALDEADQQAFYKDYQHGSDGDWRIRAGQSMRLLVMAAQHLVAAPKELHILDFGCGAGAFVSAARDLGFNVWGHDYHSPSLAPERFAKTLGVALYDVIVAREVIEHLHDPLSQFAALRNALRTGGVLAFQTSLYNPGETRSDWWYIGPASGHISLYSDRSLGVLAARSGFARAAAWEHGSGIEVWTPLPD